MRFSGHDRHLRYHPYLQDAYGPSRIQDCVQRSQAFYSYNQTYQQQFSYNSYQNYINSCNPPHRVPISSEFARTAGPGYTHLQNRQDHFRIGSVENQQYSNVGWGFTVADKFNPLAVSTVAAPSRLTQIAGKMEVAQRATNLSIGQSFYVGPSGRGDRGAHWGQLNHSGPPLNRGGAYGRSGGGRQIPPHSSRPTKSQVASAPATAGATCVVQSAPSVPGQKPLPAPATPGATHSSRPTNSQVASAPATAGATSVVHSAPSFPGKKPLPAPATAGATYSSRPTNSQVASAPATAAATSVAQSAPSIPVQKPLPEPATAGATHSSRPTNSQVASAPPTTGGTSVLQSTPSVPKQKPSPTLAQVPSAPLQPPPQNAWCEICKVHCGIPAKLEEHKNGKRHKKKLSALEKLKILKAADGQQSEQMPTSQLNSAVDHEKIQELEKGGCLIKNIISEATVDNQHGEIELQKETGTNFEVPAKVPEEEPGDNSVAWDLGSEVKIGGRGSKYMKSDDGSRRPVAFPQPTQAPSICQLCNVKCDSESLFNDHMSGKRHKKNLRRASRGLQALYPPDANALADLIDFLVERGISNPQILSAQLVIRSALSQTQTPGISSLPGPLATQIQVSTSVAGSGSEPECQQVLQTQESEAKAHVKSENSAGETNCI